MFSVFFIVTTSEFIHFRVQCMAPLKSRKVLKGSWNVFLGHHTFFVPALSLTYIATRCMDKYELHKFLPIWTKFIHLPESVSQCSSDSSCCKPSALFVLLAFASYTSWPTQVFRNCSRSPTSSARTLHRHRLQSPVATWLRNSSSQRSVLAWYQLITRSVTYL